jgi:hypothetical protein
MGDNKSHFRLNKVSVVLRGTKDENYAYRDTIDQYSPGSTRS